MRLLLKRPVHTILWPLTLFYPFITICMGRLEDTITGFQEELEADFFPSCTENADNHIAESHRIMLNWVFSIYFCCVKTTLCRELNVL